MDKAFVDARKTEKAFHTRLKAVRHELKTNPNPWKRAEAAGIISHMTCNHVDIPAFPDDHLWLGDWQLAHTPELDKYMNRCRRLWREQVVNAQRLTYG